MSRLVEDQSPRDLRRYLDYGKRLKEGDGLDEFYQWIGKILLDGGAVYSIEERAMAFEIGICERVADLWPTLVDVPRADLVLYHPLDKCGIYRSILQAGVSTARCSAFLDLLGQRYKKQYAWIGELAGREQRRPFAESGSGRLFGQFLAALDSRIPQMGLDEGGEVARLKDQLEHQGQQLKALERDLEHAEDRVSKAQQGLRDKVQEMDRVRRQLRDEQENGEKLRSERKTRIKSQRQSGEAQRELDTLRREFVKQDGRLKEMAKRLARAEERAGGGSWRLNIEALRQMNPEYMLGLDGRCDDESLGRMRRRFAAAFHPDRAGELPPWVGELFVELLGAINEACDRAKKK